MKQYYAIVSLIVAGLCGTCLQAEEITDPLPTLPAGKTWKLVWHDEFDGDKLDESKWDVAEGRRRDGWWSRKAISLDGKGHLAISTLK